MEAPIYDQDQERGRRSYENSPWINVYDWQVTQFENHQTGEPFWDIKLASNTFIEKDGNRIDVSHHHFTCNYEPAFTHGEPGTPRCTRGIHFPEDWDITLKRFENIAPEGQDPVFKEVSRIEGVTPQQLSDGLHERAETWRSSHRREDRQQTPQRNERRKSFERDGQADNRYSRPARHRPMEPSR